MNPREWPYWRLWRGLRAGVNARGNKLFYFTRRNRRMEVTARVYYP